MVYLLGVLVVFVIMRFGFGPASMSMHLRPEYDLNIYYLIGQAWMQGNVPYLSFADLKGPLVFLLHGAGSVISPGSFLGACLLESLLVGVGIVYAYRATRLLLPRGWALGGMGAYSVSVLYFSLHPAELVWVLQQVALYYVLRWCVCGNSLSKGQLFVLGASLAAALLVKFNLAAFWLPVCIWGVCIAGRKWPLAVLLQALGAAAVLLPILAYFCYYGAMADLFREYVLVALAYGRPPSGCSALFSRGWLLAAEMLPLHLHQALPDVPAAILGWCSLLPCAFLPCILSGPRRWWTSFILVLTFLLLVAANYGGSRVYLHYAFPFSLYGLISLIVIARGAWIRWVGACVLAAVVVFAIGLPLVVRQWRPGNGNAEMRSVTGQIVETLVKHKGEGVVILNVENGLHLHRLSGTSPGNRHFIPSMIPGGWEQHRTEMEALIRRTQPRFVVGSVSSQQEDTELLNNIHREYRACRHADMGLPAFPPMAKCPEYLIYVRND